MNILRRFSQRGRGWTVGTITNLVLTLFLVSSTIAQADQPAQTGTDRADQVSQSQNQTASDLSSEETNSPETLIEDSQGSHKITICHATSSDTNPFLTIHVDQHATNGHFDNKGTTLAGHEGDFIINEPDAECPTGPGGNPGDDTGTVTVKKVVSGGDAVASDFSLHVMSSGVDVDNSPQAGSATGTLYTLAPGNYTISETGGPNNFTASFSSSCAGGNITVVAGQSLTCTVTNTFDSGSDNNDIDLAVTKSVSNSSPFVGNSINYTVSVTNNGPANATGVVIADSLPSGVTFVSSSATSGSFSNGSGTWTIGDLDNGATATLTITATVNSGTGGNTITNTATASGNETDTDSSNDSDSASLTVQTNAAGENTIDLAVSKTVNDNNPGEDDNVTFTLTVTNNGPHSASNVVLNDLLPTGLTFVSSVAGQGSFNNATGVWTIGSLNNAASVTLTVTASVDSGTGGTTITNTATTSGTETDNNPSNNTASVDVNVGAVLGEATTDLSITKTVNDTSPKHNDDVTYTLTVTNNGPGDATGVTVNDSLPDGTDFISSTTATGSFDNNSGIWTIGSLADGQSATLSLIVNVTAGGGDEVTNTATVQGIEDDANMTNNTASADFTVPENGRSSSGSHRSSSGSSFNDNGQVLGESDVSSISIPNGTTTSTGGESPAVLGESVELPRTGTPVSAWLLLFVLLAIPFALQRQIKR